MKIHVHEGHGVAHCGRRARPDQWAQPGRPATCQSCLYNLMIRTPTGGKK